jgi:F-type H+-transporting ATPase subunit b
MEAGLLGKLGFDLEVAIANLVNFLIIFLLFRVFFFKKMQQVLDARRQHISQGLQDAAEAERARKDAQVAAGALIREAKVEADHILEDARTHAGKVRDQAVLEGAHERSRIVEQGARQLELDRKRMEEDVEHEMTKLVATLSEKVIGATK